MKLLVLPRDANPYQEQLYSEVRRGGSRVRYLGELTPSRTLNLLLLPFETLAMRLLGWRFVHIHWLFGFALPGSSRHGWLRRGSRLWFTLWLQVTAWARMHLVWTAHNVLPHEPIFDDDVGARRALVRASSLVVAHSPSTLQELGRIGAPPRRSAVLDLGPGAVPGIARSERRSAAGREFLFFGQIHEYKGVEDLLAAVARIPEQIAFRLRIVGRCPDPGLLRRLDRAAAGVSHRVEFDRRFVPDGELAVLLGDADVVVLPFRKVTTSSSAHLALSSGLPLLLPALPAFDHLPDGAVRWYDGSVDGLVEALVAIAKAPPEELEDMARAAREHRIPEWADIAEHMLAAISAAASPAGT